MCRNQETINIVYIFIGFFENHLPTPPYLQSFERQWWPGRRLCVWIQRRPFLHTTSGVGIYHGGRRAEYSFLATSNTHEAPVKVQRKDKEMHRERMYLEVHWIVKVNKIV